MRISDWSSDVCSSDLQEHACGGALLRLQLQQVATLVAHAAIGDFVAFASGEDVAQRGLAGPVGAHDGVHFTGLQVEREALEDFAAGDGGVEVFDLEHVVLFGLVLRPSPAKRVRGWGEGAALRKAPSSVASLHPRLRGGRVFSRRREKGWSWSANRSLKDDVQQLLCLHRELPSQLADQPLSADRHAPTTKTLTTY